MILGIAIGVFLFRCFYGLLLNQQCLDIALNDGGPSEWYDCDVFFEVLFIYWNIWAPITFANKMKGVYSKRINP